MALIPKPNVNIRWAENGNQLEPATEVQELGFVVEKPPYEVVNWLHNKHDTSVAYLYQEGFADWDIETEYSNTSYVKYDGVVYKAKLQNIGKQPDTNPDNWEVAFSNYQDYLDLYQDLQDTKNVSGHADNLVYKDSPVMSGKAVGTAFSANSGIGTNDGYQFNNHSRDGLFHNGTNPVVLNDGATVASFSGNINTPSSKDVVTFDMLQRYIEIYKVGSLYLTTNNVNPSVELGYGTWSRYAEGRALVGFSSDVSSTTPDWVKQGGRNFGNYEEKLTISNIAPFRVETEITRAGNVPTNTNWTYIGGTNGHANDSVTDSLGLQKSQPIGNDQAHNNVQPSIVVFIWRRVS